MKKTLLALVAGTLLFSCNRTAGTTRSTNTPSEDRTLAAFLPEEFCFQQVNYGQKRDTAWVHLNIKNAKVSEIYLKPLTNYLPVKTP